MQESLAGFFLQPMKKCRERPGSAAFPRPRDAKSARNAQRCLLPTVHTLGMPLNRRRRLKQRRSCNQRPFTPNMGSVVPRKFWFPVVVLMSATIAVCGLSVSGCEFANDNVGSISGAAPTPAPTAQIPESMKTNDMGEGAQGPPQGL